MLSNVEQVIDLMLTIELALELNPGKNKDRVVARACTHMRHRKEGDVKLIVASWAKRRDAFTAYSNFMEAAGL